jgi:hypothetical protein
MSYQVTSSQLRAARSFLGERLIDAAERSGLTLKANWRSEQGSTEVPNTLIRTMSKLVGHYGRAGAQFGNRDGVVGVWFPVDAGSADKGA